MSSDLISRGAVLSALEKVFYNYGMAFGEPCNGFAKAVPDAVKSIPAECGTDESEECRKARKVKRQVTEIVNRQLVAGRNNYKEVYDCFHEIVKVVQDNY